MTVGYEWSHSISDLCVVRLYNACVQTITLRSGVGSSGLSLGKRHLQAMEPCKGQMSEVKIISQVIIMT